MFRLFRLLFALHQRNEALLQNVLGFRVTKTGDGYIAYLVVTPRQAAAELRGLMGRRIACGLLFGAERMGLTNDDLALADTLVSVPLNPSFSSLNLAQAVLVLAYEWFQAGDETSPRRLVTNATTPAPKEDLINFFGHLERELDESGFLRNIEKRPSMVRNIRNIFQRSDLTKQEIRTLHGIVKELRHGRQPKGK